MSETTLGSAFIFFFVFLIGVPILFGVLKFFGVYVIVKERQSLVYILFGNVAGQISEPGLHLLWFSIGPLALIVNWLGKCYRLDMRLDQVYLRSQPVNSEEGAPMGIGIWYEMYISDPRAYLFRNADPRGSLAANVGNSTVRCLSNLPLERMMSDRHAMSQTVREEVSPKSHEWGYKLGSSYIRKVHFRDAEMIRQIESKVVNRLRQVTSAIKQDGANQVNIITSTAERTAAVEFAKAGAIRPKIVGETLQKISQDQEVAATMFEILEMQRMLEGNVPVEIIPPGSDILAQLLAAAKIPAAEKEMSAIQHKPAVPPSQ
jgi:regulator of protease activity HflC (stomatin/prohibitin superfamily)